MINRFDGDPKILLTNDGADLQFIGGQPVMDGGLENQVLISLFTKKGWVGNSLFENTAHKIGSDFLDAVNRPITMQTLNDIRDAAEKAISADVFGEITVTVTNPKSHIIQLRILIDPPGGDVSAILLTKNGLNWQVQATDPAYRRIQS